MKLLAVVLVLLLAGCAGGYTHRHDDAVVDNGASGHVGSANNVGNGTAPAPSLVEPLYLERRLELPNQIPRACATGPVPCDAIAYGAALSADGLFDAWARGPVEGPDFVNVAARVGLPVWEEGYAGLVSEYADRVQNAATLEDLQLAEAWFAQSERDLWESTQRAADSRIPCGAPMSVTWTGHLLGITADQIQLDGNATLNLQLDTLRGALRFDQLATSAGPWNDGDLAYDVLVRRNEFVAVGGDDGTVRGEFFGRMKEGMGGTLQREDLVGAFAGRR